MNIQAWNALLVLSLLIVLSGGGYILYQNNLQKQAEAEEERIQAEVIAKEEAEKEAARQAALFQGFEDFLNEFLQDVYDEVNEYKQSRIVMTELLKPSNLRNPSFVQENAQLADSTVMSLQLQMNDVLNEFEAADKKIEGLLAPIEEESRDRLRQRWNEMRDENINKFVTFFDTEQDILSAQLDLMKFYNEHRAGMSVDVEQGRIVFEDTALEEQEALLRGNVMALQEAQKDVLKSAAEKAEETDDQ